MAGNCQECGTYTRNRLWLWCVKKIKCSFSLRVGSAYRTRPTENTRTLDQTPWKTWRSGRRVRTSMYACIWLYWNVHCGTGWKSCRSSECLYRQRKKRTRNKILIVYHWNSSLNIQRTRTYTKMRTCLFKCINSTMFTRYLWSYTFSFCSERSFPFWLAMSPASLNTYPYVPLEFPDTTTNIFVYHSQRPTAFFGCNSYPINLGFSH